MSFISDSLRKISYDGGGAGAPPPGIHRGSEGKSPLKYILLGAVGFVTAVGVFSFIFSEEIVSFIYPPMPPAEQTQLALAPTALPLRPIAPVDAPAELSGVVPVGQELPQEITSALADEADKAEPVEVAALPQTSAPVAELPVAESPAVSSPQGPQGVSADFGMVLVVPDTDSALFQTNSLTAKAVNALNKGDDKAALEHFLEAYSFSQNSNIAYNIALLYIQLNEPDLAIEWINEPALGEADRRDLLIELIDKRYLAEAEAAVKSLAGADRHGNLLFASAYLNEVKGDIAKAAEEYGRAMVKSGYDIYITYAYARSQDMLGNYPEAVLHYSTVAKTSEDQSLKRTALTRLNVLVELTKQ